MEGVSGEEGSGALHRMHGKGFVGRRTITGIARFRKAGGGRENGGGRSGKKGGESKERYGGARAVREAGKGRERRDEWRRKG